MRWIVAALPLLTSCISGASGDSAAPCAEGTCPLAVSAVVAECGADVARLSASADGPGMLNVVHEAYATGCCPTVEVSATLDADAGLILPAYTLIGDDCDCVCSLDLRYTLHGLPAGPLVLRAPGGEELPVTVP